MLDGAEREHDTYCIGHHDPADRILACNTAMTFARSRSSCVERRWRSCWGENRPDSPLQFSAHIGGSGAAFLAAVDEMGPDGIVSTKVTSRYSSGRTKAWLKTKTFEEDEFVVGTSKGDRAPVALLAREAMAS